MSWDTSWFTKEYLTNSSFSSLWLGGNESNEEPIAEYETEEEEENEEEDKEVFEPEGGPVVDHLICHPDLNWSNAPERWWLFPYYEVYVKIVLRKNVFISFLSAMDIRINFVRLYLVFNWLL